MHFTAADGLPPSGDAVWDIYSEPSGVMWFACVGGLCRYDPEGIVNYDKADGLATRRWISPRDH